jgi:hypothetical protein
VSVVAELTGRADEAPTKTDVLAHVCTAHPDTMVTTRQASDTFDAAVQVGLIALGAFDRVSPTRAGLVLVRTTAPSVLASVRPNPPPIDTSVVERAEAHRLVLNEGGEGAAKSLSTPTVDSYRLVALVVRECIDFVNNATPLEAEVLAYAREYWPNDFPSINSWNDALERAVSNGAVIAECSSAVKVLSIPSRVVTSHVLPSERAFEHLPQLVRECVVVYETHTLIQAEVKAYAQEYWPEEFPTVDVWQEAVALAVSNGLIQQRWSRS